MVHETYKAALAEFFLSNNPAKNKQEKHHK